MSANTPAAVAARETRKPSPFTSGAAIIAYVAFARIVLYCFAGPRYGYFRDELYYLACGEHPALGYVDQPPLIGWIAWVLQHTVGTSLWALRLLPALAGTATILLAGLLARELGGRRWAMFLASLAALMAPVSLALSHLFTMNAFDPLLWMAIAYLVVRIAKSGRETLWLALGALAGVTILNKYGVIFWLSGVVIGVCLTPLRQSLRHRWFWFGCILAAAVALPNFVWQWQHQFPFLQLMHNVRQSGRDIALPPLSYLQAQAQMLGFIAALLVPFALLFFFSKQGRPFRALGYAYLVFLAEMMILRGKMYYVAPVYPIMFAAGAVWIEGATERRLWIWARPALALAIIAVGGIYAPTILPILSVPAFLAYEHKWASSSKSSSTRRQECFRSCTPTCLVGRRLRSAWRRTITRFRRRSSGKPRSLRITMVMPVPSTSLGRGTVSRNPSEATRITGSGDRVNTPARASLSWAKATSTTCRRNV